tara:strand:+ start:35 stop:1369 length:1335 start_codon:yes stop_codon:yes gene_type:complete
MAEQKVSPIDPSTLSWRDKVRNLATTRYGYTGKQLAEAILGESEEEKYMNYLEKIEAGLLPPPKNFTSNRPVSDMFGGEGISDIGILDATLAGISGMAIPKLSTAAALTESGVLGADAVGEYRKGNTVGAAIMGTLAGVPPLLRYANPVKNISSKEVAEDVTEGLRQIQFPSGLYKDQRMSNNYINPETREVFKKDPKSGELIRLRPDQYPNYVYDEVVQDRPDLQRRMVTQGLGIGALAAPFMTDPVMGVGKGLLKASPIQAAAKLTSPSPALSNPDLGWISPLITSYSKFVEVTRRGLQKELGERYVPPDIDYSISNMLYTLNGTKNLNELSYKDIKNIFLKSADEEASGFAKSGERLYKEMYDLFSSDEYIKAVLETYENAKNVIKNDPTVKKLSDKFVNAEQEIMKLPGGFSNPTAYKTSAYARMEEADDQLTDYIDNKY